MTKIKQPEAQAAADKGGDTLNFNVSQNSGVSVDLGQGYDTVNVKGNHSVGQVRLTFTSSEVGNFTANDSGALANQDGGLAVRLQAEDADGALAGPVSRFDDEGISFVATGDFTFDVRDLVSGTARGDGFKVVRLGTAGDDVYKDGAATVATYINGGAGNDRITTGAGRDFLVGGDGNDRLSGGAGADTFIGGAGNDRITGGAGRDTAIINLSTDGVDRIDLGAANDIVNLSAAADVTQVRLTFAGDEVGDGSATGPSGGLAVRVQIEGADDVLAAGPFTRTDDEGVRFVSSGTFTFDVRDVSGTQHGDQFAVVQLGTAHADTYDESASTVATYIDGGSGNDTIDGGAANDFLVGGAGDDTLRGGAGDDSFIGGSGNDTIIGAGGNDTFNVDVLVGGADNVVLGDGNDIVNASGADGGQIRLTFNADEVGNGSNTQGAGDAGPLAITLQAEDADGAPTGDVGSYDDEGITFNATGGSTFDVREGTNALGGLFSSASFGTAGNDVIDQSSATGNAYMNGGLLSDTLLGGSGKDYLNGGGGQDRLDGGSGNDTLFGGTGLDTFAFTGAAGNDTILDFRSGKDQIDLSSYGITASNISFTSAGGNTFVFVDSDHNGTIDFNITVVGTTVTNGDFIF